MRYNLSKKDSTKPERIVYEVLKELRIPFRHRWMIEGREIDFVFYAIALEIDGHEQDTKKNNMLVNLGYTPIHLSNNEINKEKIKSIIKKLL